MKYSNIEIELIESKWLAKLYHFMKLKQEKIISGLDSKWDIYENWKEYWKNDGISDFARGAERIFEFNVSKTFDDIKPNSSPVGSDLMFETDEAIIHIDIKTVQVSQEEFKTNNIGDANKNIFVGNNQTSYRSYVLEKSKKHSENKRFYKNAFLPNYYSINTNNKIVSKICLTYFICVIHDITNKKTLSVYIACMPNGQLVEHYGERVLSPGKMQTDYDKKNNFCSTVRFNWYDVKKFELLNHKNPNRVLVTYMNEKIISENYKKGFMTLFEIQKNQIIGD